MTQSHTDPRRAGYWRAGLFASVLLTAPLVAGAAMAASVTVFATGLDNPRSLKFGPDGNLYVAEGGTGGVNSTAGQCDQVVPPIGPYAGSNTGGRISKIDANGVVATVTNTLPSDQTSSESGSLVSGVADIAFIGNTLYALLSGAGCSHGVPNVPNAIVKVNRNTGTWSIVANLSHFQQTHPVANPEPDDFEPDGTWYSMVAVRGDLYAVEPNHGEVDRVTTGGQISRVVDVSAHVGHVVPTAIAYHGNFYFGNLGTFPQTIGSSKVWKLNPAGQMKAVAGGFDMILGLVIDQQDRTYVLEMAHGSPAPAPAKGRITRVDPSGAKTTVADGLNFPTGMTMGPDGALYVSANGFGAPPGAGQILKIEP